MYIFITPGTEHGWVYILQIAGRKLPEVATAMTDAPASSQPCTLWRPGAYPIWDRCRCFLTPPACFLCNHLCSSFANAKDSQHGIDGGHRWKNTRICNPDTL